MDRDKLDGAIRKIKDYPKPGILFYDITTLINNAEIFNELIAFLKSHLQDRQIDFIVGIESRGFIFGAALANALNIGFVPIRKKGKLPSTTVSEKYSLEYGYDEVEIHIDAFAKENLKNAMPRVVLIDDLIATGGTAQASVKLIQKVGADCIEAIFILNLANLEGVKKLQEHTKVFCVLDI